MTRYIVTMSSEEFGSEQFGNHPLLKDAISQCSRLAVAAATELLQDGIVRTVGITVEDGAEGGA